MRKYGILNLLLLGILLWSHASCVDNSTKANEKMVDSKFESNPTADETPKQNDLLMGTWIVKDLLINGKPDPENFPVNNDELTFNSDMTIKTIDRTFNLEELGTWERLKNNQFAITTEEERVVFQILQLTNTELVTKMVTDEIDMVIKFKKAI